MTSEQNDYKLVKMKQTCCIAVQSATSLYGDCMQINKFNITILLKLDPSCLTVCAAKIKFTEIWQKWSRVKGNDTMDSTKTPLTCIIIHFFYLVLIILESFT